MQAKLSTIHCSFIRTLLNSNAVINEYQNEYEQELDHRGQVPVLFFANWLIWPGHGAALSRNSLTRKMSNGVNVLYLCVAATVALQHICHITAILRVVGVHNELVLYIIL